MDDVQIQRHAPVFSPVRIARVRILPAFELFPLGIRIRKMVFEEPELTLRLRPEELSKTGTFLQNLPKEYGRIGALRVRMEFFSFEVVKGKISLMSPSQDSPWQRDFQDVAFSINWKRNSDRLGDISLKVGPVELKGQGEMESSKNHGRYSFSLSSVPLSLDKFKALFSGMQADSGNVQLNVTVKGDARHFEPAMIVIFSGCALNDVQHGILLSEMSGCLLLSKSGVELRDFWASVNNKPVRLNVKARWEQKLHFSSSLSLSGNFLKVKGICTPTGWNGYARLKTGKGEWTLSLHDLRRDPASVLCRSLQLRRQDRRNKGAFAGFALHRLFLQISADTRYLHGEISEALFKDAKITSKFWLRLKDLAFGLSASIQDLDVARLLDYASRTYPATGRLSAELSCKGTPETLQCVSPLKVSHGSIGPSDSSAYWARQTGIEALNAVAFDSFSGNIYYANGFWTLKDLRLDGDSMHVAADLKADDSHVSGALSIRFPTASIQESSDLKWLLRFVEAGDWVDFDFKVAGYLLSPRVQWLGGEFKKKVESRLAPWMKNELTRQIEKRLAENSSVTMASTG